MIFALYLWASVFPEWIEWQQHYGTGDYRTKKRKYREEK